MAPIQLTDRLEHVRLRAFTICEQCRHEFVMPEHLLAALLEETKFFRTINSFSNPSTLYNEIFEFLTETESVPMEIDYEPTLSTQFQKLLSDTVKQMNFSEVEAMDIIHVVNSLLDLEDSWASYLLGKSIHNEKAEFMCQLIDAYNDQAADPQGTTESEENNTPRWKQLVTCMNDHYTRHNPLIGRDSELERTIQVLCRRDKNNPLHVGEAGVGKTALVWGLARMIEEQRVPQRLSGSRIYQIDMGTLVAGTQFRGDFEKRIKQVMDGIEEEGDNNIVYIDEIHTLIGAGATQGDALDASNMLKPYLESGHIRFIGSTTYEEFNRYFARSQGLLRRFQQIDIPEPSISEAKHILTQLKPIYEEYHGVTYTDEAIDFAVEASAKHITGRFLPDKAIDLIDEAGAAMELAPSHTPIGKKEIAEVLSKTCKVDTLSVADESDYRRLENLQERMLAMIYGQNEAVQSVVEAVQLSSAGLTDDNKPMASLLFVGPTGVGKTEVAKQLAKELNIELIRFDMSEYTEKHAVAKLIGSPAGYVGYEDGGLLTDAIRKSPNCVLLLDEIEKAHPDIYNILLQVMDYARLTDNKGRKADFRHVILIMTSNAGAQYASKASVGFNSTVTRGENMMKQVKRTFKPEFLNRLSGTVVFHDMDRKMATLILKKKIGELEEKLQGKQVTMTLSEEAIGHLLDKGFTAEYGAREMDRVIAQELKPMLMREILFGQLKQGGSINIIYKDGSLSIG